MDAYIEMTTAINESENIKPSRINRRRKKKWRAQSLTSITTAVMIRSHSQKTSVGIRTPLNQGPKGHDQPWFFYAHQKQRSNCAVCILLWWAVLGSPLKGWPVPWPVVRT
jgi:hypothetical protein